MTSTVTPTTQQIPEERRELMSWFGHAVYLAQLFEASVALAITSFRLAAVSSGRARSDEWDALLSRMERATLGQLVQLLAGEGADAKVIDHLQAINRRRIDLIHKWWSVDSRRLILLETDGGRETLLAELKRFAADLQDNLERLLSVLQRIRLVTGAVNDFWREDALAHVEHLADESVVPTDRASRELQRLIREQGLDRFREAMQTLPTREEGRRLLGVVHDG